MASPPHFMFAAAAAKAGLKPQLSPKAQEATRLVKWWTRVRDVPEVMPLYGLLAGVFGLAIYTTKKVYFNNQAGTYVNTTLRGDYERQVEDAGALADPGKRKKSFLWRIAQIKVDDDGANIGVFNNRMRPHQYSKPGVGGVGAGVPA